MAVDKKVQVIVNTAVDSKMSSYKIHVNGKPKNVASSQAVTASSSR